MPTVWAHSISAVPPCVGILTRIAATSSPHLCLYGQDLQGTHLDALAINYDDAAWQERFLENWPEGSPAWLPYVKRIVNGPDYRF